MKIAIASDIHISEENASITGNILKDILIQCASENIPHLIIAGDLCHKPPFPYTELRNIFSEFQDAIEISIILGNHDITQTDIFSQERLSIENVNVYKEPALLEDARILLLPYQEGKSASQELADSVNKFSQEISHGNWTLISHCDFISSRTSLVPEGYFPLTMADINEFKPVKTFLGHIHQPSYIDDNIMYCGSAFALSKNEAGPRQFFILDTETFEIQRRIIQSGPLYWQDRLSIFPGIYDSFEEELIIKELLSKINNAFLGREDYESDLSVEITLTGISTTTNNEDDIKRIESSLKKSLKIFKSVSVKNDIQIIPSAYKDFIYDFIQQCMSTTLPEAEAFKVSKEECIMRGLSIFREGMKI